MRHSQFRLWIVVALLASVTLFLRSRSGAESLPARSVLSTFPLQLGEWKGREIIISDKIREVLGDGDFVQRIYSHSPDQPSIELFIAYFPTQRTGSSIHSPQNCLPGSGWVPVESNHIPLDTPARKAVQVNRFIIQKGNNRHLVLYWYQSHDRVVASEYWAKFYMVADAIQLNRTDGALVRFITPLGADESAQSGQRRVSEFTQLVCPLLDSYIPR